MAKSREVVFEASDLRGISLECKCGTRIGLDLKSWKGRLHGADQRADYCPGCGDPFFKDERRGESNYRLDALTRLKDALGVLRDDLAPHRILIHIEEAEAAEPAK